MTKKITLDEQTERRKILTAISKTLTLKQLYIISASKWAALYKSLKLNIKSLDLIYTIHNLCIFCYNAMDEWFCFSRKRCLIAEKICNVCAQYKSLTSYLFNVLSKYTRHNQLIDLKKISAREYKEITALTYCIWTGLIRVRKKIRGAVH